MSRGRSRGNKTGTPGAPSGNSAAGNTPKPGSGGASSVVGAESSRPTPSGPGGAQPNPVGTITTQGIAKDLAEIERRRKKADYSREWKRRQTAKRAAERAESGTRITSDPSAEAVEPDHAPAGAPEFTVNEAGHSTRRTYARKARVDPEQINLIAQSVQLVINGLATAFVGPDGEMQAHEEKGIVEPLTRILSKLQPETITAVQMFSDPATLLVFAAMYGSRLMAIKRDQDSRGRRPGPAPIVPSPGPSVAQAPNTFDPQRVVDGNGHLVEAPPIGEAGAYKGTATI